MYAAIRGSSRDQWLHHKARGAPDRDIHGFQYQYMVGAPFLQWISAAFDEDALVVELASEREAVREARVAGLRAVEELHSQRLAAAGLGQSVADVIALSRRRGTQGP